MKSRMAFLAIAATVGLSGALGAQGQIIHVDGSATPPGAGTSSSPFTSIQSAVNQAGGFNQDVILVRPGTYVESINTFEKNLTIRSSDGPLATTIQASDPLFALTSEPQFFGNQVQLEGFTVTGATAVGGVGLDSPLHQKLIVTRCIVRDNTIGGLNGYDLFFNECTIVDNGVGVRTEAGGISRLTNTIAWRNGTDVEPAPSTNIFIQYSAGLATAPSSGPGVTFMNNIVADPELWDPERDDFRLKPGSVCINAGNPAGSLDPDGSIIDIGALTYDPAYAPEPYAYCTGKLNGQGCVPSIGSNGQASATSAAPFNITATDIVESKPGLMFYGLGQWAVPFQAGTHCVMLPTRRTPVRFAGSTGQPCSGTYNIEFNARIQSGIDPNLVPGALIYCQWWYRDGQAPGGFGSGLTDALCFGIAP